MIAERPFEITYLPSRLRTDFTGRVPEATVGEANEREKNFLSRALAAFAIHKLSGCSLDEAAAALVDGGGDGGIDAAHYSPTSLTLWLVQSKFIESGRGEPELGDVSKFKNGIEDLLQGKFDAFRKNVAWVSRLPQIEVHFKDSALQVRGVLVYSGINRVSEDRVRMFEDLKRRFSHNDESKKESIALFGTRNVFDTPKPERLLHRVLTLATNPGDWVLDSFAGSGTTGAVAHKMGRRWIMVELGEHCHTHIIPRLKKVIDGDDKGGITEAVGWKGGGGFRYFRLAPSLLKKDKWDNWVINKTYNAEMLTEAVCKLAGFIYAPSDTVYWQHGYSTERDFIYVTTQNLGHEQLQRLSDEVGLDCTLLVLCTAFRGKADRYLNLTIKKIPTAVLSRCEWGRDDYSLKVENLPKAPPKPGQLEFRFAEKR